MKRNADGHLLYFEELFDRNNTLLASNTIDCGPDPDVAPSTPAYHPPVTPQPPATTSGGFVVAPNDILGAANVQYVNVTIDSVTYRLARLPAKYGPELSLRDLTDRFSYDCLWRAEARSKKGKSACGVYLPDLEQPRPPDVPPGPVKLQLVKSE